MNQLSLDDGVYIAIQVPGQGCVSLQRFYTPNDLIIVWGAFLTI